MKKKHENREYQNRIEEAVIDYLFEEEGNPIVAAAGGTGKSFVMAKLTKRFITEWPGTNVIVLAQDAKLLEQNSNELRRYWPEAPIGIYSSGLKRRDTVQQVVFCGIQSVHAKGLEFGKRHIVLIDEADLVSPKDETLYNKFLATLREVNPKLRVIGFTASPWRLGTGCLTEMELWDRIVINLTQGDEFLWFVDNGYLAPLVNKAGAKQLDITNIAMRGNEFEEKALQAATDNEEMNRAVVSEALKYGSDRKHWICFSAGVDHGRHLAKIFNSKGIPTEMLCGKDTMEHRKMIEAKWRSGEVKCVVNAGLYGRGFDFPGIDMIIFARATQSPALWLQCCVRGSRMAPDKENCLVIDMVGNTQRLGPINAIITPKPRRKGDGVKGEAPLKICANCFSYRPIQEKTCADCGTPFPPPKTLQKTASDAEILVRKMAKVHIAQIDDFYVQAVRYKPTLSKRGQYYLKVTYSVGTANFQESLFFDSTNAYSRKRIQTWWEHRGGKLPIPEGVDEASDRSGELLIPTVIRVDTAGQYPQVVGVDFDEDAKTSDDEPF